MSYSVLNDPRLLMPFKALPLVLLLLINTLTLEFSAPFLPLFPCLGLAVLFHWLIYRPNIIPPLGIVAVVLLNELFLKAHFSLVLPGIYLLSFAIILKYRHRLYDQRFYKIWGVYGLYSCVCIGLYWILKALFEGEVYPLQYLMMGWIIITLSYPLLTLLFAPLQRLIPLK